VRGIGTDGELTGGVIRGVIRDVIRNPLGAAQLFGGAGKGEARIVGAQEHLAGSVCGVICRPCKPIRRPIRGTIRGVIRRPILGVICNPIRNPTHWRGLGWDDDGCGQGVEGGWQEARLLDEDEAPRGGCGKAGNLGHLNVSALADGANPLR
jgi:hypothetical protein